MNNIYKQAAQARGFYDMPFLKDGEARLPWHELFEWVEDDGSFGQTGSKKGFL